MEISYVSTSGTSGVMVAVIIGFISVIFLLSLAASIYFWWQIKSPPKREKQSENLTMSWAERRLLGLFLFGDTGESVQNIKPRLRALRVHIKRTSKTRNYIFLVISIIFTLYATIFLLIILAAFVFQQSWLANLIGANFSLLFPYVFLPLFIVLGITVLIAMIFNLRLWAIKDNAPIRVINKTDKPLKIQIRGTSIGEANPGTEIENRKVLSVYDNYLVEATDISGNILYSKDLSLDELDETDWDILISAL